MPFKGWSIVLAHDWHANVLSIRTTSYAAVNERRLGRYCCSGWWPTLWSSWWSVWLLFLTQAVGSQGLTLGEVICHEAAGGCLDKMTPSQTPGLPFKQRQMGPNSQTCPHLNYKHCQRHNGPEDWVHLTKVTSWGHITSSNTNHIPFYLQNLD